MNIGVEEQVKFLHFRCATISPLIGLRMGWNRFEAGRQGNHKLKEACWPILPIPYIFKLPTLYNGVQQALQDEKKDLLALQDINEHAPIKEHQKLASTINVYQADQD